MSDFAISAITQQSTAAVAPLETGSESLLVRPGNVADPVDVARFESLIDPTGQPDAATAPAAVSPSSESGGLGNVILDGIEKMSSAYNNRVDAVNASVSDVGEGGMTVQETMKLQLELMQLNLQQDVSAKIADKTSQGIQTLFKNQ
ncbi:MAG: type III secretion system inner rod subunit SctI [Verrucomicrobiota bacterium]